MRKAPRIRTINIIAIVVASILTIVIFGINARAYQVDDWYVQANEEYSACMNATYDLNLASDFLTARARSFVMTGKREHLDAYLEEVNVVDRRSKAVAILQQTSNDAVTTRALEDAHEASTELESIEMYAMRLTAEAIGMRDMPEDLAAIELTERDAARSPDDMRDVASAMMFDEAYETNKDKVKFSIDACTNDLVSKLSLDTERAAAELHSLLDVSHIVVVLLLAIIVLVIVAMFVLLVWPMANYSKEIEHKRSLVPLGAAELRSLAESYNQMYEEVQRQTSKLKHTAERDPLTGLYNRGVFDDLLSQSLDNVTLLIVDIDYFKNFNDQFGHEMGDKVLKRVADCLTHEYRTSDYVCRIGGDEFVVVMTDTNPSLRNVIARKVTSLTGRLGEEDGEIPGVTLSIGIAFAGDNMTGDELYRAADVALYQVKRRGRNGFAFYGDEVPDA